MLMLGNFFVIDMELKGEVKDSTNAMTFVWDGS